MPAESEEDEIIQGLGSAPGNDLYLFMVFLLRLLTLLFSYLKCFLYSNSDLISSYKNV